jgi:hypothetical protein
VCSAFREAGIVVEAQESGCEVLDTSDLSLEASVARVCAHLVAPRLIAPQKGDFRRMPLIYSDNLFVAEMLIFVTPIAARSVPRPRSLLARFSVVPLMPEPMRLVVVAHLFPSPYYRHHYH